MLRYQLFDRRKCDECGGTDEEALHFDLTCNCDRSRDDPCWCDDNGSCNYLCEHEHELTICKNCIMHQFEYRTGIKDYVPRVEIGTIVVKVADRQCFAKIVDMVPEYTYMGENVRKNPECSKTLQLIGNKRVKTKMLDTAIEPDPDCIVTDVKPFKITYIWNEWMLYNPNSPYIIPWSADKMCM